MERSLPSGRRSGPAGRPQRMKEAVGTESRVAQPVPAPATWPGLRLPSSCLASLLPLSPLPPPPPPLKPQHLPPPPLLPPAPPSLLPPSLCPPRPRPSQPLRGLRTDNRRAAGGRHAPPGSGGGSAPDSNGLGVRAAHSGSWGRVESEAWPWGRDRGPRFTVGCRAPLEVKFGLARRPPTPRPTLRSQTALPSRVCPFHSSVGRRNFSR